MLLPTVAYGAPYLGKINTTSVFGGANLGSPTPFWTVCNPPAIANRSALNAEPNPESGSPDIKYIRDDVLKSLKSAGSGACACSTNCRYFSSMFLNSGFGHPAFISKLLIWAAVDNPSGASGDASINTCALGFPESADRNGSGSIRREPAARISSIIVDCWALLMPSSNPNSNIVHSASITTPPIINKLGSVQNSSDSRTNPHVTAADPTKLAPINIKWGQYGAIPPEKNAPMFMYILAIIGWSAALMVVTVKIIKKIVARFR